MIAEQRDVWKSRPLFLSMKDAQPLLEGSKLGRQGWATGKDQALNNLLSLGGPPVEEEVAQSLQDFVNAKRADWDKGRVGGRGRKKEDEIAVESGDDTDEDEQPASRVKNEGSKKTADTKARATKKPRTSSVGCSSQSSSSTNVVDPRDLAADVIELAQLGQMSSSISTCVTRQQWVGGGWTRIGDARTEQ